MPRKTTKPIDNGGELQNESRVRARGNLPAATTAPQATQVADTARLFVQALASRFTPESLCQHLETLLTATKEYTKGSGEVVIHPDHTTRLRAVELLLAYIVGRPVERQEVVTFSPPASVDDLIDKARKSPVFRETIISLLEELKTVPAEKS